MRREARHALRVVRRARTQLEALVKAMDVSAWQLTDPLTGPPRAALYQAQAKREGPARDMSQGERPAWWVADMEKNWKARKHKRRWRWWP